MILVFGITVLIGIGMSVLGSLMYCRKRPTVPSAPISSAPPSAPGFPPPYMAEPPPAYSEMAPLPGAGWTPYQQPGGQAAYQQAYAASQVVMGQKEGGVLKGSGSGGYTFW